MPPLDITIPRTSTSVGPGKPYTIYHIAIRTPSTLRPIIVEKRYSDFANLHASLHSQTGSDPPAPLPAKSWFSRTVNNESLTEERRQGLEKYLRSIEGASDPKWRDTDAYKNFLELGQNGLTGGRGSVGGGASGGLNREPITTAAAWLDAHSDLKARLQEARLFLSKREQSQTASAQHEAGAGAKRCLVQAAALIGALEDGLARLGGRGAGADDDSNNNNNDDDGAGWGGERLGEGELRRRRDMLSTAKKEREGLEGVLNAMAVRSAVSSVTSSSMGGSGAATQEAKAGLFKGANMSSPASTGRRVLGGPAKETERTRELDNDGVLQLQRQIIAEQDQDLVDLTKVARRMREMGVQINEELVAQNALLDVLEQDVERVDGKIRIAKKRADKIS